MYLEVCQYTVLSTLYVKRVVVSAWIEWKQFHKCFVSIVYPLLDPVHKTRSPSVDLWRHITLVNWWISDIQWRFESIRMSIVSALPSSAVWPFCDGWQWNWMLLLWSMIYRSSSHWDRGWKLDWKAVIYNCAEWIITDCSRLGVS